MILVVADTGPIRYLVLIEAIEVLARLYDRVVLPPAVLAELTHAHAPELLREALTHDRARRDRPSRNPGLKPCSGREAESLVALLTEAYRRCG